MLKIQKLHTHVHYPLVEKEGKGSNNSTIGAKGPKSENSRFVFFPIFASGLVATG
jgi:hypothetical protein